MLTNSLFKIDIEIGFGQLGPVIAWASNCCSNNWSYDIIESAGRDAGMYRFYFDEETDYVNFILWKT